MSANTRNAGLPEDWINDRDQVAYSLTNGEILLAGATIGRWDGQRLTMLPGHGPKRAEVLTFIAKLDAADATPPPGAEIDPSYFLPPVDPDPPLPPGLPNEPLLTPKQIATKRPAPEMPALIVAWFRNHPEAESCRYLNQTFLRP